MFQSCCLAWNSRNYVKLWQCNDNESQHLIEILDEAVTHDVFPDITEGLAVLPDERIPSWPFNYCFHLFVISKTLLVLEVVNGQGQDLSRLQLQLARSDQVQINSLWCVDWTLGKRARPNPKAKRLVMAWVLLKKHSWMKPSLQSMNVDVWVASVDCDCLGV